MSIVFIRIIPLITSLLVLLSFELILAKPSLIWILGAFVLILVFGATFLISTKKINRKFWRFLLSPFLFIFSSLIFFIFFISESVFLKHFLIAMIAVILGIILENTFRFFYDRKIFFSYSLDNLFHYTNLLSLFLFFSGVYSINVFFEVAAWVLLPLVFLVMLAMSYQNYWVCEAFRATPQAVDLADSLQQKVAALIHRSQVESRLYILIPALVLLEIFWVVSYLPTSFYVNGFFLILVYYGITNIIRARLQNTFESGVVKRCLVWGVVALAIILFTARW
ncbi:hypothetical protein KKD19_00370 [Patescibacteria group bacterium]|nr:hypothetical protein [Patescibacteria group bacterium]MBU4511686.1 hypothetical protein [Patescibacteria group bacterium]